MLWKKSPSHPRNLALWVFGELLIVLSTKHGKSFIPPLFNGLEVLFSATDEAKHFAKNFSKNSNLDDLGISLPIFYSRTNLKWHKMSITPTKVKKVTTNLDSKASDPDCITVVALKNCKPEILYIYMKPSICVKQSFVFQIAGR